jgi:mono/diheme cytochrome c family protein
MVAVPVSVVRAEDDAASPDFFETKVRPVLATNCYTCHTTALSGGLRLDSPEAIAKGGDHGPTVTPGDPDKSLLITAVRQTDENLKMPMGGKLKDSEIEALAAWVKAGAKWPRADPGTAAAIANAAPKDPAKYVIAPAQRQLWSLLPLKAPTPPEVKDPRWNKTPIDKFVYAKLEHEGLKPVAPASKRDLIRRATLDLTGLPPTPEETEAFEKDNSPDAFAKVVDRLLASPHYGERWGRAWLDVARYG